MMVYIVSAYFVMYVKHDYESGWLKIIFLVNILTLPRF